jgi:ectoine hydroxylase-related dioxygenase (phytanoyl-CoA dioxygenase family)
MQTKKIIKKINSDGYVILENMLNKKHTKIFKQKLERVLKKRLKNKEVVGHHDNQVIYNYFLEDKLLLKLIYFSKIDEVLKKLLEPNYVLQSTNAQNRIKRKINPKVKLKKKYKIGATWHTDSRYLNNKRLSKGFSYLVIIALDAFTKSNGPTKFILKSNNFTQKPKRNISLKYKELIMKEGSICIMDSGMWHKGGESSDLSRWSIFSIYTGWFVKPYFNYQNFIKKNNILKKYKKLLHFNSIPPEINELRGTVTPNK